MLSLTLPLPSASSFPDCTKLRDHPLHAFLFEWLYGYNVAPHHLIILLPSCTLCIANMFSLYLSHYNLAAHWTKNTAPIIDTFVSLRPYALKWG
jgi:hypothetical protein